MCDIAYMFSREGGLFSYRLGRIIRCILCYAHLYDTCGWCHYSDVMASQITSLTIVYSTVYSGTDQRKHQSSASLAFVRGIHRWPVNSPRKGPVTLKMFSFYDVIMYTKSLCAELFRENTHKIDLHFLSLLDTWEDDGSWNRLLFKTKPP